MWTCEVCGAETQDTYRLCQKCGNPKPKLPDISQPKQLKTEPQQPDQSPAYVESKVNNETPSESIGSRHLKQIAALMTRYADAYRKARAIVGIGNSIKWIGIVIALLFVLGGFSAMNDRGPDMYIRTAIGIGAIIIGLIGGAIIFIIGILVSVQGQTLKATLDSAVNNSPFLTNEHRARIMSLPRS
jgi:amino acid permease